MRYNPDSVDSMFGVVVTRLDQQEETLKTILAEVQKTNGRVSSLEQSREVGRAQIAVISTIVSFAVGITGWAASHFLKK